MENTLLDLAANVWSLVPSPAAADAPARSPWPPLLLLAVIALAALPGLAALARAGAEALSRFARQATRPAFFGGLVFAAVLCCQADKFPTNPVQSVVEGLGGMLPGQAVVFSPAAGADTLARSAVVPDGGGADGAAAATNPPTLLTDANRVSGLALVSAAPAAPGWDVPPAGAEPHGPWAECGAHLDFLGLLLTNARPERCAWEAAGTPPFPVGTNLHGRLFASVCGAVSFGAPHRLWPDAAPVPDGGAAPLFAPLKGPLGLAPPQSAFWRAATPSNTLLLTWRDVFLGRDSNLAASVQCELAPSGDFAFRVRLPQTGGEGFVTGVQNAGGGESVLWDSNMLALARSPGGVEIRGRGFGRLPPGGADTDDTDGDGVGDADEVFSAGTSPLLADTDGDGLRDGEDPSPLNPDADGDLAADSLDPLPLAYADPAATPGCCTNARIFHVHNGLPSGGTDCPLAEDPLFFAADPLRFPATVTLTAPVPAPGAVLWVGGVPLVMRDPGSWTLWLDKTTNQPVRLCAPRGTAVDYAVDSAEPGFLFQPAPPAPESTPLPLVSRDEGAVAAPFLTVEPASACFHNSPVTFRAAGCASALSGLYAWTYGGVTVETNVPSFTVGPDFGGLPQDVSVSFMPDGLGGGVSAAAGAGGPAALSAGCGWPAGAGSGCGYCRRHLDLCKADTWWCELCGGAAPQGPCPALMGYIPRADGTNAFFTLPVPRRPAAWPEGCASFRPWPVGHAGQGDPPPPPTDPEDCGHGPGCGDCVWVGDHWHRRSETYVLFDHSRCCACPEHNLADDTPAPGAGPVVFAGDNGLSVAFKTFDGGAPSPLAEGPMPEEGLVVVAGLTPSAAPRDRSVRFTRYDPSVPTTYYETDLFTVMSLDLQPDADLDGEVGAGDAPALAADWDRRWTVPAGTNAWFPVKIFNDVALPGGYTLAVSGSSGVVARCGGVVVHGGGSGTVAFQPGSTEETVEVQAEGPGTATLTVSFAGSGALTNYTCATSVDIKAWGVELYSAALDENGVPLSEGGRPVPGALIPPGASLSTYVPFDGGGAPNLASTTSRWVTFTAVWNAVTNGATLSMTQEYADGFKVWDMDFEGATTNGAFAWLWQGESNEFLRAECPTNATSAMMPLTLAYLDPGYDGATNEVSESFSLYRYDDTNGFWGSTCSITGPREDIGMPAFSKGCAFVVRLPAGFAEMGLQGDPVCEIAVADDDPVTVPLTQDQDGNYVSCLVVPVSELDADADLGLEGYCDAVKINLENNPFGNGWTEARVNIKGLLNGNLREITSLPVQIYFCTLFSALVSADDPANARAVEGVAAAGETARTKLSYAATALLSPTAGMINDMLPRHSVWVHSGHGSYTNGIQIIEESGVNLYKATGFKASDILQDDLAYSLVFMNTCESTDKAATPIMMGKRIMGFTDDLPALINPHAVRDIGMKLNAVSYVGWDCSVETEVSVFVPTMLMEELDTRDNGGSSETRSASDAVRELNIILDSKGGRFRVFSGRLRCLVKEGAYERGIDLNKKPN